MWKGNGFVKLAIALFITVPALAAIDGVVLNATSGKPAAGVSVSLVQPSQQGMVPLGKTTADAAGKFSFNESPKGPALIQVSFQDVTYNKMLMPGAPASGVQVDVYDATRKPVAKVAQHMVLLQPNGAELAVNETYLIQDEEKLTYNDPDKGTLQFYLPPDLKGEAQVTVNAPGGMPIQRSAEKTKQANVFKLAYPMKPGETRVDLAYTVPAATPAVFSGKLLQKDSKTRLVVPSGVSLKGDNIQEIGKEPQTQATIYDVTSDAFSVEVSGTGALSAEADAGAPGEDTGQPQIAISQPYVYKHLYWIMGIVLAVLGLGAVLLARNSQSAVRG
jgi:5-hydroxyisourate hydrolase-like protein (transthyretin family)